MIGQSPAFLQEMSKIPLVARCDASVLIMGETGTGKELCARRIHHLSARADKPFVTVNCGAIPVDLVENELFGHEREAFTGAVTSKRGLIQEAEGGTILLDEIDSLPPPAQVKLLRFLQEKEIRPLGATRTIKVNVRVLAATNVESQVLLELGKLRRDLFYRLDVLSVRLPPLRERPEDIPLLLEFFLQRHRSRATQAGTQEVQGFALGALQKLMLYAWPGNVRELEHVVERAVLMCPGKLISESDVVLSRKEESERVTSFQEAKAQVIADFERSYLTSLLLMHRGNVSRAATSARKNRRAFFQLMQKHGIDAKRFRDTNGERGVAQR
jgi:two-component system response regulator GlrR